MHRERVSIHYVCLEEMLVAMVIAVRQALDYRSTFRAVGVCFVGWIIFAVVQGILVFLF